MKWAIAYKTKPTKVWDYSTGFRVERLQEGIWNFLTYRPSDKYPCGYFSAGIWKFETQAEAEASLAQILASEANNDPGTKEWNARLLVVELPDAALDKFEEVNRRIKWCDEHPREGVPEGSRENSLFHQGHEITAISKEGHRILQAFLTEKYG